MFEEYEIKKKEWLDMQGSWRKEEAELRKKYKHVTDSPYPISLSEEEKDAFVRYMDKNKAFRKEIADQYGEEMEFRFLVSVDYERQEGEYKWLEGIGAIDVSIVDIIKSLNEWGYKTKYSCSGIQKEHKGSECSGYISFEIDHFTTEEELRKAGFASRMFIEKITHINQATRVHLLIRNPYEKDRQIKKGWRQFMKEIEKVHKKRK